MRKHHMVWAAGAAAAMLAAGVSACSDTTNPLAGTGQSVSLSFMGTTPTGSGVMSVQGDSLVVADSANRLVITSVEIVLRKIELSRVQTTVNCDSVVAEDACSEFETGSLLVNLPLGAGVAQALAVPIDSGTYDKVEFKIHKPGTDSVDNVFHAANPTWPANTSIRVTGTYNGTPFTYTTPLDAEQEYQFVPPLVIDASGSATNLTIRLDVSTWFKNGAAIIDPSTANVGGVNEGIVKENIKNSIKAFEDHDHDGHEANG